MLINIGLTPLKAYFVSLAIVIAAVEAEIMSFQAGDFDLNPTFNDVRTFEFFIDISETITGGSVYANPDLDGVNYRVFGTLGDTPSGFPAFDLNRVIDGDEFYSQGSSLSFEVDAGADLSDGLQVADLTGIDPIFVFDGREVGTGRYHPALLQLNADGTGSIMNSNNFGGINPASEAMVDVDFGEEYITELVFDPTELTLIHVIPEPGSLSLFFITAGILAFVLGLRTRRFKN